MKYYYCLSIGSFDNEYLFSFISDVCYSDEEFQGIANECIANVYNRSMSCERGLHYLSDIMSKEHKASLIREFADRGFEELWYRGRANRAMYLQLDSMVQKYYRNMSDEERKLLDLIHGGK